MSANDSDNLDLAQSVAFFFAFLAGGLVLTSGIFWLRSSTRLSRADEAAVAWQPIPAKLEKLESFVRKSSFYYRVGVSYRWREEDRAFSESDIPRDWWEEGTAATSVGDTVTLWLDPAAPGRAMWNPRFQAERYRERMGRNQSWFWVGLGSGAAFAVVGRLTRRRPNQSTQPMPLARHG